MHEYIELGSAPADEPCVSVTPDGDYVDAMRAECRRYKALLEKKFADAPDGVYFSVKWFQHDFGRYAEVVVNYDEFYDEETRYASHVESNLPAKWADDAPVPYVEPMPELSMSEYLNYAQNIGPVYRVNNLWHFYQFMESDGTWGEERRVANMSPEYAAFLDDNGLRYYDTSREYCRKG